ncbi:MAG: hypothetical protein QXS62_04165 [Sulfolobales archaeon]
MITVPIDTITLMGLAVVAFGDLVSSSMGICSLSLRLSCSSSR